MKAPPRKPVYRARRRFLKDKLLFSAGDIADALNSRDDPWDEQRGRRFLRRTGLGFKLGGRWITTRSRLQRLEPDMLSTILSRMDHGDDDI